MEEAKQEAIIPENQNPLEKVFYSKSSGVVRKKCPVCNSKVRLQADAMLEKGDPHPDIRKFLEDNGELVTLQRIKYHHEFHLKNSVTDAALEEYASNMGEMVKRRRSPVDDLEHLIGAGWMEYGRIAVLPTNQDFHKEYQRQKMLEGITIQIRDSYEALRKMQGESKDKEIEAAFEQVWRDKLAAAKTDDEKNLLIEMLRDLRQRLERPKRQ